MTSLQNLVVGQLAALGVKGRPLSYKAAADRAQGKVTHEVIRQIANGTHSGRITDRTIDGLVLALDVRRSEILRAMNRTELMAARPFEAPERWQRLTPQQRKLVIAVGNGLLDSFEAGLEAAGETPAQPLRLAARRGKPEHE